MGSWPNDTAMVEGRVACNDELLFHTPTDVARYYYTSAVVESMVVTKRGVLCIRFRTTIWNIVYHQIILNKYE